MILPYQEQKGQCIVKASDGTSTDIVTLLTTQCPAQTTCVPRCPTSECTFLCGHLKCTCWNYTQSIGQLSRVITDTGSVLSAHIPFPRRMHPFITHCISEQT